MGTGGLQNPNSQHLVVGDTLPNGPVAEAGEASSDGASASSSSGEGMGESLNEDLIVVEPFEAKEKIEEIKKQIEEAED